MVPFGNFGWNFGFGFGWLAIAIFVVAMVFAIVRLVRLSSSGAQSGGPEESALDILKKRYARGEISREEFEAKKKQLS